MTRNGHSVNTRLVSGYLESEMRSRIIYKWVYPMGTFIRMMF